MAADACCIVCFEPARRPVRVHDRYASPSCNALTCAACRLQLFAENAGNSFRCRCGNRVPVLLKKRHFLRPRTLWQWLWRNVAAPFSRAHVVGQDEWLHAFLTLHEKHRAEQHSLKREYEVLEEENDALKEELKKMERQLKRRRTENQRLRVLAQRNS